MKNLLCLILSLLLILPPLPAQAWSEGGQHLIAVMAFRKLPKPAGRVIRTISALASAFFGLYSVAVLLHLDSIGTHISLVVFSFFTVELGAIALTGFLYPQKIQLVVPVQMRAER